MQRYIEMQSEIFQMVCQYYDNQHPNIPDNAISDYMGLIYTADAKTVRKAHKYWVNTLEKEVVA